MCFVPSVNRPKVCMDFQADPLVCGTSWTEALKILSALEDN
ncbi:MAG: hypothetical protein PVF73_04240 [Bacteroidales bacterium]